MLTIRQAVWLRLSKFAQAAVFDLYVGNAFFESLLGQQNILTLISVGVSFLSPELLLFRSFSGR
jgi:hypothetical protein